MTFIPCRLTDEDRESLVEARQHDRLSHPDATTCTEALFERIVAERVQAERAAWVSKIETLADEYAERSADTEMSCERYPWGVAADDLRALLPTDDTKENQ